MPAAELAVKGDRPAILEIEDLEPHGIGIGGLDVPDLAVYALLWGADPAVTGLP